LKRLPTSKQSTDPLIYAVLKGRWFKLKTIAEILRCSETEARAKLDSLAENNQGSTLLIRDGTTDPRILLVPRTEWKHLLTLLRKIPDD
jgi:hypothetical protein